MDSEHKNTYTDLFSRLGNKPESVSDNDLVIIERFADELYVPLFIYLFYLFKSLFTVGIDDSQS